MKKNIFSVAYWKAMKTEQISVRIFYVLTALAVIIFGLFFLVGYNMPFLAEPEYNAPLFTDVVLWFLYLMVVLAAAVTIIAVMRGYRERQTEKFVNGVPAARIAWTTAVLLAAVMLLTFVLGSSSPITVNGKNFQEVFWLKATDMFIYTTIVLIVVAAGAVGFSLSGMNRKLKKL